MDTSLEKNQAEQSKESLFLHNWEDPPKTNFSVDACWHGADDISRVQCFVTNRLSKVIAYIKSRSDEDLKKEIWWEIIGREIDSRSTESSYFAQFDRSGTALDSTPLKPDLTVRASHIVNCMGCKWKFVQKLAEYMKYDKSHKDEAYYSDYILSIMNPTGRVFANGVEIIFESHRRTFYVKEDGTISFRPAGKPLPIADSEKHW